MVLLNFGYLCHETSLQQNFFLLWVHRVVTSVQTDVISVSLAFNLNMEQDLSVLRVILLTHHSEAFRNFFDQRRAPIPV
jgi:hypothetical protein